MAELLERNRTICAVEIEPHCQRALQSRINDGTLPWFPVWDDLCTFCGNDWRGIADRVCAGWPCQDISSGGFGAGITGSRSGLWKEVIRIISEVRPQYVFLENSPVLTSRGLGVVLGDLAAVGYDARWGVLGGKWVGAPIERERIFIAGTHQEYGETRMGDRKETAVFGSIGSECPDFWSQAPPKHFGMEHGMDNYMDQVSAIGNGQIPQVAALAWHVLSGA